jgi:hypothetical protein
MRNQIAKKIIITHIILSIITLVMAISSFPIDNINNNNVHTITERLYGWILLQMIMIPISGWIYSYVKEELNILDIERSVKKTLSVFKNKEKEEDLIRKE